MPANGGQAAEMKMLEDDKRKLKEINTFTRWVNQHLKQAADSPQIENLEADLSDGIMLIKLTEVLAGRKLPRYNKRPTMRTQKLDNISLVLNFLQKEEGIKIVTIDSSHIADRNLKLILGLIWTLILHYSLSHRLFASTADQQQNGGGTAATTAEKREKTPKQLLLSWIQAKLPDRHVSNFTSNWNDGILLGALVDACVDGRFGKWRKWSSGNAFENTRKAMQAAEKALGVETLITAEELTSPEVDEKSVMTYLAQFARSQPKLMERIAGLDQSSDEEETAETKGMNGARENQEEEEEIEPDSDTAATSQLDHVLKINDDIPPSDSSALFTTSGSEDKTNSNDIEEQHKKFKQYNKSMEEVNASDDGNNGFLEEDDNNSLINETITSASTALQDQEEEEKEQRAHLAWADGPGLAVGVVGQLNPFVVHNANQLGAGELTLNIDGPGNAVVSTNQHPHEDTCHVEYTVQLPGLYTVSVLFNGAHIQGSPFKVFVKPPSSESLSKASTPTTPVGNEQQQQQEPFDYLRMSTNYRPVQIVFEDSPPAANVQNGGGHHNKRLEHVVSRYPEIEDMDDGSKLNGDAALVQVSGEGLDHFVPGQPADFVVDTSATGINTLFVGVVTARGPTQELNIRHIGNGNYVIAYTVPFNSDAHVFIKYGEEHVRGSPFTVCPRKKTHQHQQHHHNVQQK